MAEDKKPSEPGTIFTHLPLPYIVTARVVIAEDKPPELHSLHLTAYSFLEAMLQATQQLGGQPGSEDSRIKIEKIEPDVPAYQRIFYGYVRAAQTVRG